MTTTRTQSAQPCDQKRVLIVDDEPAILFAYRKLIERTGVAVDVSENLAEAIEMIRTRSYFVVITDLRLAGSDNTDGLQILCTIREQQPEAKLILVSGYSDKEFKQTALELGASYYFEKPVQPAAILKALLAMDNRLQARSYYEKE